MKWQSALILVLAVLLYGCSASPNAPATTAPAGEPATPGAEAPTQPQPLKVTNSSGAITGVLLDEQGAPVTDLAVFLADLVDGPQPGSKMITFQLGSSKRGPTDAQGNFAIDDIKPGSYTLVIYTPGGGSTPIPPPGGAPGSAILVEVKAGQTVDLGKLQVKRPQA